jgi:hypothetical protein
MNAGESALWYIKIIEKEIIQGFIKSTIIEYFTIFYQAYGFHL